MIRKLFFFVVLMSAFPGAAHTEVADRHTNKGTFIYTVKCIPAGPVVGSNVVTLSIKDAGTGAALEGATVKVVPWMTMHGHGSPKSARVTEKGNGVYEVEDLYYSMEGSWDLLINIHKGNIEDSAHVYIEVK